MATEKIIKLGQKLHALAVQGVGGEQETATKMLTAFLEKYDLQISDVAPEARTRRIIYKVTLDNKQMMVNLVASIVGSNFTANNVRQRGLDPIFFVPNTGAGYIADSGANDFFEHDCFSTAFCAGDQCAWQSEDIWQ